MIGGRPTVREDIPVSAVLLLLYVVGAVSNQSMFQMNRRKAHRFYMSWAMFGFCMARVATMVLRIAWTTRPNNARLAIAAGIFTNIGVLVIYIILLLLVMRVFRATHPKLGWNKHLGKTVLVSYFALGGALCLTIGFTIVTFYTLDPTLRTVALWVQRAAILYILIFNLVTMTLLLLSWLLPRASHSDNFGTGSMESKMKILAVAVFFSVFIAGFRMGLSWSPTRLASNAPWYDSKAAFYVIEFGFEIFILYWLLAARFDRRYYVPNNSHKAGDYFQFDFEESAVWKKPEEAPEPIKAPEQAKIAPERWRVPVVQDSASELETISLEDKGKGKDLAV